jgi:hypothetical protein
MQGNLGEDAISISMVRMAWKIFTKSNRLAQTALVLPSKASILFYDLEIMASELSSSYLHAAMSGRREDETGYRKLSSVPFADLFSHENVGV